MLDASALGRAGNTAGQPLGEIPRGRVRLSHNVDETCRGGVQHEEPTRYSTIKQGSGDNFYDNGCAIKKSVELALHPGWLF